MIGSYYEEHKETIKARSKARYQVNKEICIAQAKEWKERNPEKFKASQDKWMTKNPVYSAYHNAKRRAKELKLPFNISWKDLTIPDKCPILDIQFKPGNKREESPSLDRINPNLGYVKGNVQIISMKANRIKSDGTAEEHRKIADYIDKYS